MVIAKLLFITASSFACRKEKKKGKKKKKKKKEKKKKKKKHRTGLRAYSSEGVGYQVDVGFGGRLGSACGCPANRHSSAPRTRRGKFSRRPWRILPPLKTGASSHLRSPIDLLAAGLQLWPSRNSHSFIILRCTLPPSTLSAIPADCSMQQHVPCCAAWRSSWGRSGGCMRRKVAETRRRRAACAQPGTARAGAGFFCGRIADPLHRARSRYRVGPAKAMSRRAAVGGLRSLDFEPASNSWRWSPGRNALPVQSQPENSIRRFVAH